MNWGQDYGELGQDYSVSWDMTTASWDRVKANGKMIGTGQDKSELKQD